VHRVAERSISPAQLLALLAVVVTVLTSSGCGVTVDPSSRALNALDDAISRLSADSADWQDTLGSLQAQLKDVTDKLPRDVQTIINTELSNLAARSIAAVGTEFRCNTDFVGQRVKLVLERIRAKLTRAELPARPPTFCSMVPSAVDLSLEPNRRNRIDLYGYDLDRSPPFVLSVVENGGGTRDVTDVAVTRQTHYQATINLGANGVTLNSASLKLRLAWEGQTVSEIPVIQPEAPKCQRMVVSVPIGMRTVRPPLVVGDDDFNGHGPLTTITVQLGYVPGGNTLGVSIQMTARQTNGGSDTTQASGTDTWTTYTALPPWSIARVVTPTSDSFSYTDTTRDRDDPFDRGVGGLVRQYVFVGDTTGPDAGVRTQATVFFNQPQVELISGPHCRTAGRFLQPVPMTLIVSNS
jgi:hypothetical protein